MFKRSALKIICLLSFASYGYADSTSNTEINQFFANLTNAFNSQNLDAVVNSWIVDGEVITLAGGILKGQESIRKEYVRSFAGPFKDAKYQYYVQFIRVKSDSAIVDGIWKTTGGPANYPSCGLFVDNLVNKNGTWKIELSTFFVPKTGHTAEVGRTISWTKACAQAP